MYAARSAAAATDAKFPPAAGLDETETEELGDLLRDVNALGITMCVVDHDMSLVMRYCHRVAVLDAGELIADGLPDEIRKDRRVIDVYLGRGRVAES